MTIAEARSRCAGLRVAMWDEETIAREVMHVTAALVRASPQVTPVAGSPGVWWAGASGFESLGGEAALARTLSAIARRWHPEARVGIADSCVAARAATWDSARAVREGDGTVIVPSSGCAAYLASAPLGMLPMEEEQRETLLALGLRTVGAFAALAIEDVERRWGASGVAAWRLAHGDDLRRPVLARLDAPRAVSADLQPSAQGMEPVLFLVRAALDRLVQDLVTDGRAAAVIAITITLDDARGPIPGMGQAHTVTREVRLSRPLARVSPLFERCRALLDTWALSAPAAGVRVAITATTPLVGEQGELLDPAWRDPAAADAAFARLRATLGTGAIVRPVLRDTHRPERAGGWEQVDELGAMAKERASRSVAADGGVGRRTPMMDKTMAAEAKKAAWSGGDVSERAEGGVAVEGGMQMGGGARGAPPELQHAARGANDHHHSSALPTQPLLLASENEDPSIAGVRSLGTPPGVPPTPRVAERTLALVRDHSFDRPTHDSANPTSDVLSRATLSKALQSAAGVADTFASAAGASAAGASDASPSRTPSSKAHPLRTSPSVTSPLGMSPSGMSPSEARMPIAQVQRPTLSTPPPVPSLALTSPNDDTRRSLGTAPLVTPTRPARAITPVQPTPPLTPHRPALRQLDPPEPLDVACEHDIPRLLRWGGRGVRVERAIGPERLTGDWWETGYARDYWRCEDAAGRGDLLIYRERPSGGEDRWFVHGWYD